MFTTFLSIYNKLYTDYRMYDALMKKAGRKWTTIRIIKDWKLWRAIIAHILEREDSNWEMIKYISGKEEDRIINFFIYWKKVNFCQYAIFLIMQKYDNKNNNNSNEIIKW